MGLIHEEVELCVLDVGVGVYLNMLCRVLTQRMSLLVQWQLLF